MTLCRWLKFTSISNQGNGLTLLPVSTNVLQTAQLDRFVARLLSWTKPRVVKEHGALHDWWIQNARPVFTLQRTAGKQKDADAREQKVMQKRRDEQAAEASAPKEVVQAPVYGGGNTADLPSDDIAVEPVAMEVEPDPLPEPSVVIDAPVEPVSPPSMTDPVDQVEQPGSSSSGPVVVTQIVSTPRRRSLDKASWDHIVQGSQSMLDANRVEGLIPRSSGSYIRASNGLGFTPESLPFDQDPSGRRGLLRMALACALVVVDFSNLTGGDFGRCSDELIASWLHALMSRQSIGKGGVFLSGRHLFNITSISDDHDVRMRCISEGNFANLYSSTRDRHVNVIANVRENVRLVVIGDSGLLTFPSKGGKGKIVQMNTDIIYPDDAKWKKLEMLVVGGTVVSNFTRTLHLTRLSHEAEMVSNMATARPGIDVPES